MGGNNSVAANMIHTNNHVHQYFNLDHTFLYFYTITKVLLKNNLLDLEMYNYLDKTYLRHLQTAHTFFFLQILLTKRIQTMVAIK